MRSIKFDDLQPKAPVPPVASAAATARPITAERATIPTVSATTAPPTAPPLLGRDPTSSK